MLYLLLSENANEATNQTIANGTSETGYFYFTTKECEQVNFIVSNCYFHDITLTPDNAIIYLNNGNDTKNAKGEFCRLFIASTAFDRCKGMICMTNESSNAWSELNCDRVCVRNCSSKDDEKNNIFCSHYGIATINLLSITTSSTNHQIIYLNQGHYNNDKYPVGTIQNMNISLTTSEVGIKNEKAYTDFLFMNFENNTLQYQGMLYRDVNIETERNISNSNFIKTNLLDSAKNPAVVQVENTKMKLINCYFDGSATYIGFASHSGTTITLLNCNIPTGCTVFTTDKGSYATQGSTSTQSNTIEEVTWFITITTPARTWSNEFCKKDKKSMRVKVVYSLAAATAALSDNL